MAVIDLYREELNENEEVSEEIETPYVKEEGPAGSSENVEPGINRYNLKPLTNYTAMA